MSEELNLPQDGEQAPQQEAPQYTEMEQRAMSLGWRPKEEWDGSEDDFIDAKEFVRRQPLFEKISHQSRELKQVRQAVEALKTHLTTVREGEYQRALEALKAERRAALSDGDGEKFDRLDDEIKTVEAEVKQIKELAKAPAVQEVHPEFQSWMQANPWYETQNHMRIFADEVGKKLHASGMAPAEVLKAVEKEVRKEFPNKFSNPNKELAPKVAASGGKGGSGRADPIEASLSDVERRIMDNLVRSGVMTKDEYIADLKRVKQK